MKKKGIETSITYNEFDRNWNLFIIDRATPGTHETYNVVFNSGCIGVSYRRKGIAQAEAQKIIYKYKHENRT